MVDHGRDEPGRDCWCHLVSTFRLKLSGVPTGLKLEPFHFIGEMSHRMDVECKHGCWGGTKTSSDTKFDGVTLDVEVVRKMCCGECSIPKVHCGGYSTSLCDSGTFTLGRPLSKSVRLLWSLRNDLDNSKNKIENISIFIVDDYQDSGSEWCQGRMSCRRLGGLMGWGKLCHGEPRYPV